MEVEVEEVGMKVPIQSTFSEVKWLVVELELELEVEVEEVGKKVPIQSTRLHITLCVYVSVRVCVCVLTT